MLWLWFVVSAIAGLPAHPPIQLDLAEGRSLAALELCFPSGMQLHVLRRSSAGMVAVSTVIEGGAAAERAGERGAAHLAEHLWFRARPNGGPTVEDLHAGALGTGSTFRDDTVYTTVAPGADLSRLLALEAARLVDPLAGITDDVVAKEREVVRKELIWRGEHGGRRAVRALEEALWPEGHPYRFGMGDADQVAALDRSAVEAYTTRVYRPGAVSIRIEGDVPDVDQDRWVARMEKAFGERALWLRGDDACTAPPTKRAPPAPAGGPLRVTRGPAWWPTLFVAWSLPPAWTAAEPWERMSIPGLRRAISKAVFSVPGTRRWDAHVALSCDYVPGRLASSALCVLEFPYDVDPDAIVKAIGRRVKDLSVPALALERENRLRDQVARQFTDALRSAESLSLGSMEGRARQSSHAGLLFTVARQLEAVWELPEPRIAAFSEKYYTADRMAAAVLLPGDAPVDHGRPMRGTATLTASGAPRWSTPKPAFAAWRRRELANGVVSWAIDDADYPFQSTELVFRGGAAHEPALGADLLVDVLERFGNPTLSYTQLRRDLGARFWTSHSNTTTWETAITAGRDTPEALWTIRSRLEGQRFDFSRRQPLLDGALDDIQHTFAADPGLTSRSYRLRHLLPGVSGAAPWWEEQSAARFIREEQVRRWAASVRQPRNAVLITSGDIDPDQTSAAADKYIGGWRTKKVDPPGTPAAAPPPPPRDVMLLPFDAPLADVRLTCRLPGPATNAAALRVLRYVLHRGLWQTLRDEGRTYTPGVDVQVLHPELALLHIDAPVAPGDVPGTVAALLDLLRRVRDGVDAGVLADGQAGALGEWGRDLMSADRRGVTARRTVGYGLPIDGLRAYPGEVRAVTAKHLTALLAGCVGHEAVTAVGPVTAEAFTARRLPARVVDWRGDARRALDDLR